MPNYLITVPIKGARGIQTYTVDAKSEKEALKKHKDGDSDFDSEEVEVTDTGTPKIELNE